MASSRDIKKSRGRPATGRGTGILVRLQVQDLAELDGWIADQPHAMTRPEAIRTLLRMALEPKAD